MSWMRVLLGGLLPACLCLATWSVAVQTTGEWRRSLALATVAIGVLIGVSTEVLSLFGAVNITGLLAVYAAYAVGLYLRRRSLLRSGHHAPPAPWHLLRTGWMAAIAVIAGILLALAVIAPPNNWDSMTYHMARVAHWAAQGDVAHYATHIDRQLFTQPWAEYAILHTYVLAGSDLWANAVQWTAMAVTLVMVSLVARNIGLNRSAQVAAVIVVLTLPMGITQSATTQNDYVAAMWVAILAALVSEPRAQKASPQTALLLGTATGLAAMTKGTSYFFLLPLLAWWIVRQVDWRAVPLAKIALAFAVPALLLSVPGFLRNIDTFSQPLGPPLGAFVNAPISPRSTAENLVRHAFGQFGVPSDAINRATASAARSSTSVAGLNLDRPGTTFPEGQRYAVTFGYREDDAQAFAAMSLLVVSVPFLILMRRRRREAPYAALAALFGCAVAGAVLLESYFRWNPWNARYLLPFFVVTAVLTAAALDMVAPFLRRAVLIALLASSMLWVLGSDLRPIARRDSVLTTAREDAYFEARPELRLPYQQASAFVRSLGHERVGFVGTEDGWEYPLWILLNKEGSDTRLDAVAVSNASRQYERATPDVIVCTSACSPPAGAASWSERRFGPVGVWTRG